MLLGQGHDLDVPVLEKDIQLPFPVVSITGLEHSPRLDNGSGGHPPKRRLLQSRDEALGLGLGLKNGHYRGRVQHYRAHEGNPASS